MLAQTKSTWRAFPPVPGREDCPTCQGTGWELVSSSGPAAARRCPCIALSRSIKLKEQVRIPLQYEHCTLQSFRPSTLSQTHGLAEAWRFVERFPNVDRGVVFVGGTGVGKTHLAVGIALELVQRFHEDILFLDFQTLPGLCWSLGRAGKEGNPATNRPETASLLVLDDFGAKSATHNQYQSALQIFHARMRAKKPILCTTACLEGCGAAAEEDAENAMRIGRVPNVVRQQAHALLLGGFKIVHLAGEDCWRRRQSYAGLF